MRAITFLPLASLWLLPSCREAGATPQGATRGMGQAAAGAPAAVFLADGELQRPRGYRSWIHVGTPLTPNDLNNGKAAFPEFHTVYVDPASYRHYLQTGEWRDGTVMVKELTDVGGKAATSGNGYFQGEFIGVEASVKSRDRFLTEPGHWGFFRFTDEGGGPPHRTAAAMPTAACAACHAAAAGQDLVFTQYYPVLRAAKKAGAGAPEDG